MSVEAKGGRKAPSLKGRFAAAVALWIGFYVLAVGLAAGLLALPVIGLATGHFNIWLAVGCVALGVSILTAAFQRAPRFEAPGPRLTRDDHPRLLSLIESEARALGEEPPAEVYSTMEVNAAVTEPARNRRVMIVGLPLLHVVTERGFRGVVAHELGHYAGGDTRLGPWVYKTREAIGRTVERLSEDDASIGQRIVRVPFVWYGKAFVRITNSISRRQEFAADECAAQHAGRDAYVEALRRVHAFGPAFDAYWQTDVVPVLSSGARPPLAAGFARFVTAEPVADAAGEALERELGEARTDPYDSHPALAERIAALEHVPPGDADASEPAIELVDGTERLEEEMLRHLFGPVTRSDLKETIAWEDVGARVYLPGYEELAETHAAELEGVTFATLPAAVERLDEIGARLRERDRDLPADAAPELAAAVLGAGGVLALKAQGWEVEALPGLPVLCRRGDTGVSPHQMIAILRAGNLAADEYEAQVRELGIADVAFDSRAPAQTSS